MKLTAFLLLAALLLAAIAYLRPPEYDEAYSIFLTAGDARPPWPSGIFTAGDAATFFTGHASFAQISHALKTGDVHPPLYFWCLEIWRHLVGPSWFAARLLSVVFSLSSLALIAWLAEAADIPVLPALILTLLSYGFAYTGILARGFALAQFLNFAGFAIIFQTSRLRSRRLAFAAGLVFGAASFTNYLAIFTSLAMLVWLCLKKSRQRFILPMAAGLLPFILLDATYFLAQRHARSTQFVPFAPLHALGLLIKDTGGSLFGGLPLYAGSAGPLVALALLVLFLAGLSCVLTRRHKHTKLLALTSIAPPCGLLALGFIFDNTPIEIRYLAFSLPYIALLLAAALPRTLCLIFIIVEACATVGLATAPATMQPQALAAKQISYLAPPGTLVLLPYGNDGVGIPGPFIAAAPQTMRILLLHPGNMPNLAREKSLTLATLNADSESRATPAQAIAYLQAQKCFTETPATKLALSVLNRSADQHP